MLEEDAIPGAGRGDFNEERIDELRKKLGDERRRSKDLKGADAGAVLAARVEEGRHEGRSTKRKRSEEKVTDALKIILKKGRRRDNSRSPSRNSSHEEDEGFGRGGAGDLASKQRRLKGYSLMHEQLGTLFGSSARGSKDADEALKPAALRYLLTCALP